jgi:uncharacterized protein involved in exopolysaccharide biosynthesis
VNTIQTLVNSLAGAFEQARIDEVRSTPAISVVERPRPAVRPDPRGTPRKAAMGGLAGLVAGLVFAILRERLRHARVENDPDVLEMLALGKRLVPHGRHQRS